MLTQVSTERNQKLRKLHHDILNCLNVISMGADVIEGFPDDKDMVAEIIANIKKEQKLMNGLVGELFEAACEANEE